MTAIFQQYAIPAAMPRKVYFEKLIHENGAVSVEVSPETEPEKRFLIYFDGAYSYRYQDEGDMLSFVFPSDVFPWPLCIVRDSVYLKQFHEMSADAHLNENIVHYCVCTPNEIIDVLTNTVPVLSIVMP